LLACLRAHGQRLDFELADEVGVPVSEVRDRFAPLLKGEVVACKVTRFDNGKPLDAMIYRAAGYFPPAAPGRKPKQPAAATGAAAPGAPDRSAD
jgi:hypothetical protein